MLLTWESILAISALVTVITAGLATYVRLTIRAEFQTLLKELNGTYLRSTLYAVSEKETERRLGKLEDHNR